MSSDMLDPDEAYARKLQHMYEMENKYRLNSLRCAGSGNEYNTRKRKRVGNNSSHSGSTSWTMSDSITWKKAGLCICEDLTRLCVLISYHWPIWDIGTFVGRLTKLLIGLWVVFYCHVAVNRNYRTIGLKVVFPFNFFSKVDQQRLVDLQYLCIILYVYWIGFIHVDDVHVLGKKCLGGQVCS